MQELYQGKILTKRDGTKINVGQISTIDLNSTDAEIAGIFGSKGSLVGQVIQLDEAFFFAKFAAIKQAAKETPQGIVEEERNKAIARLRNRGATVIISGASESLSKAKIELKRLEDKGILIDQELQKSHDCLYLWSAVREGQTERGKGRQEVNSNLLIDLISPNIRLKNGIIR